MPKCTRTFQINCCLKVHNAHLKLLSPISGYARVKCWTTIFSIHASECPVFIMNQLKSIYNIPFLDSYSHPVHSCLSMIASNMHQNNRYQRVKNHLADLYQI